MTASESTRDLPGGTFRPLFRGFVRQFLENEMTSAEGNVLETVTQILSLLAAASVCLSLLYAVKFAIALSTAPVAHRLALSWTDRELMITISMSVAGFVTVLAWDSLMPGRRDCFILGVLPVKVRTVFAAKGCAVLLLIACSVAAANGFTTFIFPWAVLGDEATWGGYLRFTAAHAVTLSAATVFAFALLLTMHGLISACLSHRAAQRLSVYCQLAILVAMLCALFLMPPIAHPSVIVRPENWRWAVLLPPFWFLGLYGVLAGDAAAQTAGLARLAAIAVLGSMASAAIACAIAYPRRMRKAVEEEELPPGRPVFGALLRRMSRAFCREPVERAVFEFVAKTMVRNRRHRVLLAFYCTVGLGYAIDGLARLLKGGVASLMQPSTAAAAAPLLFAFFLVVGMRVLFNVPVELRSNWVFRITDSGDYSAYLAGVRKVMFAFALFPVVLAPLPVYIALWGWGAALRHAVLVALLVGIMIEWMLRRLDRIPFTCSLAPGKANLKAMFVLYWAAFSALAFVITNLETLLLYHPVAHAVTSGILCAVAWLLGRERRRNHRRLLGLVYEDRPDWAVVTLELGA